MRKLESQFGRDFYLLELCADGILVLKHLTFIHFIQIMSKSLEKLLFYKNFMRLEKFSARIPFRGSEEITPQCYQILSLAWPLFFFEIRGNNILEHLYPG